MYMCDIHMHIVPGVDDGSWSLDMSRSLLYMAYEQGVRKIIATPHSHAFTEDKTGKAKKAFFELMEMAKTYLPDLRLYLGCEVKCGCKEMDAVLKGLKEENIPSLNQTRYVLTEFLSSIDPEEAMECVNRLKEDGWYPVLAHVERYGKLFEDGNTIEKIQSRGCFFQMNAYSVYDEENEKRKEVAMRLIREKRVTFLGSDAHRTIYRPPSVKYGLKYLYENFDREYIDRIAFKNAEQLLKM